MSRRKSTPPAPPVVATPTASRRNIYDWDGWADAKPRAAVRGTHFTCDPKSFTNAGREWSRRNDCTWIGSVDGDTVSFTITRNTP
jgi:hypothetical protein